MAHIPTPRSGEIEFVGKGNQPAKFVIIPKDIAITNEMGSFVEHFMFTNFGLSKPKVLLSVTGGAQEFKMLSTKLEQVFNRGIVRAAENTDAWIVTGGLDSGVMQFVGDAIREQDFEDVPCIGIATLKKVSHYETLAPEGGKRVLYSQQKPNDNASAALNPDHTHFILVDSPENKWGEEISIRAALEDYISRVWQIPLVLIVVNGGPGTIATVVEGVENRFPVIIVEGSGRAADAIAGMLKAAKGGKGSEEAWNQLTKNMDVEKYKKILLREKDNIILYNPNDDATEDMDIAILRAVLSGSRKSDTFRNKLFLGVEWGRSDIILDLFDRDEEGESTSTKLEALNHALQMALELNRPEIFELLVDKGAQKEAIDLKRLYKLDGVKYLIDRLLPFSGSAQEDTGSTDGELSTISNFATSAIARASTMDLSTHIPSKQLETAKKVLKKIHPMYYKLLQDGKTTFADMLVWAIMVNRHDLAKAIWKRSALPIHTALCAAHLYRTFAEWFQGDKDYPECAEWFENQAIKVLDKMEYKTAKKAMKWEWRELESKSALEIAEIAECKDWMSHQYVQRYLDSVLYSDDNGKIMVGTRTLIVLLNIVFPFTGHYKPAGPDSRLYHFYNLPIVKFWSSTLTFMLFLFVIGYVVVSSGDFDIFPMEYVLWTFVASTIIEEFMQFLEDPENYFVRLSNKMDGFMLLLLLAHIVVRIAAYFSSNAAALEAAIDILIVASICCWMKLLYIFTFSKTLGPLFFVIMGLIKDVGKWIFIFAVFCISFQIGFTALTKQADPSAMWTTYPDGTLGVSFVTIIGDFSYAMETMNQTHIGVILLALYALIAQIMLVNLLIAMMGDTYGDIKDNSDKEWKFFRFSLVSDYSTCSPRPPPFNLLLLPFSFIATKLANRKKSKAPTEHSPLLSASKKDETGKIEYSPQSQEYSDMLFKKMKISRDRVLEEDEKEDDTSIQSLSINIRESLRVMNTQRDSDRIFLEQNLKVLQDALLQMQGKINILAAQVPPPQPTSSTSSASTTTTTTTSS